MQKILGVLVLVLFSFSARAAVEYRTGGPYGSMSEQACRELGQRFQRQARAFEAQSHWASGTIRVEAFRRAQRNSRGNVTSHSCVARFSSASPRLELASRFVALEQVKPAGCAAAAEALRRRSRAIAAPHGTFGWIFAPYCGVTLILAQPR